MSLVVRYLLPRILIGTLVAFLGIYFLYREFDDRLFLGKIFPSIAKEKLEPRTTPEVVDRFTPPLPAPEITRRGAPVEAQRDRSSMDLERRLVETHAALAESMEQRLYDRLQAVQGAYVDQSTLMEETRSVVEAINHRLRNENLALARDLRSTMNSLEEELLSLDQATDDLDQARQNWAETYRRLAEIGEVSGDMLNEANYRFETYQVGVHETMAQVVRNVESQFDLAGADTRTLLEMFNEVDTRLRTGVGRRSTSRVVANSTLRVPIPRSAGRMMEDYGVSTVLDAQREAMEQAHSRQLAISRSMGEQVSELRDFVQRLDRLEALSRDMERSLSALDPQDLTFLPEEVSPAQREAWERFNALFDEYARTTNRELRQSVARRLESAARELISVYAPPSVIEVVPATPAPSPIQSRYLTSPSSQEEDRLDDLQWLREYLDRYDPGQ